LKEINRFMKNWNRREFIRKASIGMAAVSVGGAASRAASSERRLGVALVGLGSYATGQLAPALQHTQRCRLTGIVTGSPEKIPEWRERYGIPDGNVYNYENYDELSDNPDIDIVYVVLPNSMHAEYTIRAAQAGKHVICEKPMAVSVRECREMIDACKRAGVKLSIGYRLHFEPRHQEMMRLGQERVYGPVKFMEASFGFRIGDPNQWRLRKDLAGGGAMMDIGIYAIQGARYATGEEPVSVYAQEFRTDPEKFAEVDETILWQFEFPGGTAVSSTTSYSAYLNRLYAAAPEGWFEVEPAYSYGGLIGRTSEGPMEFPEVNQQALHMDDFAECILENRESRVSGEEGLRDMEIIEGIYRSIETGRKVVL
jgi:predicted dehydrogenase